jgi:hypothetical protein
VLFQALKSSTRHIVGAANLRKRLLAVIATLDRFSLLVIRKPSATASPCWGGDTKMLFLDGSIEHGTSTRRN